MTPLTISTGTHFLTYDELNNVLNTIVTLNGETKLSKNEKDDAKAKEVKNFNALIALKDTLAQEQKPSEQNVNTALRILKSSVKAYESIITTAKVKYDTEYKKDR